MVWGREEMTKPAPGELVVERGNCRLTEMTDEGVFRKLTAEESMEVYNDMKEDIKRVYDGRNSLSTEIKERIERIYEIVNQK
jgi:hypothetical protein